MPVIQREMTAIFNRPFEDIFTDQELRRLDRENRINIFGYILRAWADGAPNMSETDRKDFLEELTALSQVFTSTLEEGDFKKSQDYVYKFFSENSPTVDLFVFKNTPKDMLTKNLSDKDAQLLLFKSDNYDLPETAPDEIKKEWEAFISENKFVDGPKTVDKDTGFMSDIEQERLVKMRLCTNPLFVIQKNEFDDLPLNTWEKLFCPVFNYDAHKGRALWIMLLDLDNFPGNVVSYFVSKTDVDAMLSSRLGNKEIPQAERVTIINSLLNTGYPQKDLFEKIKKIPELVTENKKMLEKHKNDTSSVRPILPWPLPYQAMLSHAAISSVLKDAAPETDQPAPKKKPKL